MGAQGMCVLLKFNVFLSIFLGCFHLCPFIVRLHKNYSIAFNGFSSEVYLSPNYSWLDLGSQKTKAKVIQRSKSMLFGYNSISNLYREVQLLSLCSLQHWLQITCRLLKSNVKVTDWSKIFILFLFLASSHDLT